MESFRDDPLTRDIIGAAIEVHRELGAGLLEAIYERCLKRELEIRGYAVSQQQTVAIEYKGMQFEELLRYDLLVEGSVLIELKCVEQIIGKHKAQLLSYMKLLNVPTGLILNFDESRLIDGVTRLYLKAR